MNLPRAPHLILSLVRAHRKRKHRGYSRKHKKSHIPERISIQKRPKIVLRRLQIGHWETDTISCRKSYQAVQVTVERKARYAKLAKLNTKTSRAMSVALARRLSRYPTPLRLSITYDNGPENAEHLRTNKVLGTWSSFVNRSTVTSAARLKIRSAWSDVSCQRRPIWLRSHKFIRQRSKTG